LYGQNTNTPNMVGTTVVQTGYLQPSAIKVPPPSGIGTDLAQLSELARRIRNSSSSILARLEGPKPESITNKDAYPPASNVRSVLGDLLGTLYATENTLIEIDNALGSL